MPRSVTAHDIVRAIRDLGLCGLPVCVHSSFRSFGAMVGGPAGVIDAFLSEGCTLMVPTFSYLFAVPPPEGLRPPRNGWDYVAFPGRTSGIGRVYSTDSTEIDREDMGAIPAAVVAMPGRFRGNHPLNSFSAVGPLAGKLIAGQQPLDVFAPLRALAEAGGAVVLIGVDLSKMTLLHLAEQQAGRNMFRRWANGPDGRPTAVDAGGCSDGFGRFDPILAPIESGATVGRARWHVYPASAALELAAESIRQRPMLTHCGDPDCRRCDDAVQGGPIL